jgi:hypothetical protein
MMSSRTTPVVIAAVLMLAFFVWILLQMAPHGPKDGEMLVRLAVGLGLAVVGTAVVLGIVRLVAGRADDR